MNPNPRFIRSVQANLRYWRQRVGGAEKVSITELDRERENLYQAVRFGLGVSQTSGQAIELALQLFELVDRGSYWQDWIPIMNLALRGERMPAPQLEAKLHNRLGQLYRRSHRFDEALTEHQVAMTIAEAISDDQIWAEAHVNMANVYYEQRDYVAADKHAAEALDVFERTGAAPEWIGTALGTLGTAAQMRGDFAEAKERLAAAVDIWRQTEKALNVARMLGALANTYWFDNQYELALSRYLEADALLAKTNSELDKTHLYLSLGTLYDTMGQLDEAEYTFRRVDMAYLQETENVALQAHLMINLGSTLVKQSKLDEAETLLRSCVTLWTQIGDLAQLGNAQATLAATLAAKGQKREAIIEYDRAIENLEKVRETAIAQHFLGRFRARRQAVLEGE